MGNPIRFTDPDGMRVEDDYRLNQDGSVTLIEETDDNFDRLIGYHLDGDPNGNVLEVEEGILDAYEAGENKGIDLAGNEFNSIELTDDTAAKELFEFMAENTLVEFSHVKFGESGNIIATIGDPLSEGGGNKLAYDKLVGGSTIREHIHSHPTDGKPSDTDKSNAEYWQGMPGQSIKMTIYRVISQEYKSYNKDGFIE